MTTRPRISTDIGRRICNPNRFRRLDLARRRAIAKWAAWTIPGALGRLQLVCLMVGHPGSGGSLLSSLLDAHPSMAFADDFDVLDHVADGFDGQAIGHLLSRAAVRDAARRERASSTGPRPFSRGLRGDDSARHRPMSARVIGESKAGLTTRQLACAPHLLAELEHAVEPAGVRVLHLVRNPFDLIAIMAARGDEPIDEAAHRFFADCVAIDTLRETLGAERMRIVRYENLVVAAIRELHAVCTWLGVDADDDYLEACADVVNRRPGRERDRVRWSRPDVRSIVERIAEHEHLDGYSFGSRSWR